MRAESVTRCAVVLIVALPGCGSPRPAPPPPVSTEVPQRPSPSQPAPVPEGGFRFRGIVEGFYGPPWSHQDRLEILRFMGDHGMNAYFYAPKDDPYHRERWREPYPPRELRQLGELVARAGENGIEFWYAISPGLSMVYSEPTEYRALLRKIDQAHQLGVRRYALFVDDVPEELAHEADRRTFATLARAHASLIGALRRDLASRGARLVVTPTTYTNVFGDRVYLAELARLVPAGVPLVWTGVDVVAPEITAAQAAEWGRLIGRKPLVWDNYPVNDFARWRLFLGPLRHRAPDLDTAVLGIIANPMNEAHASMIALATVADYLRDPRGYDPERSRARAVRALFGDAVAEALRPFLEIYGEDALGGETNLFEPLFVPGDPVRVAPIEEGLARLRAALGELRAIGDTSASARALARELFPFVDTTAARLARLRRDTAYVLRDDVLSYRRELDRIEVRRDGTPVRLDGDLAEWQRVAWRPLVGADGLRAREASVAFRWHGEMLYLALRMRDTSIRSHGGVRSGEGDHVAVLLSPNVESPGRALTSSDVVVLVSPPSDSAPLSALVTSLAIHGFFAPVMAGRRGYTFPPYVLTSFRVEPTNTAALVARGLRVAGRQSRGGYEIELAIPTAGLERLGIDMLAVDAGPGMRRRLSLTRRGYPANPKTYAELRLVP